MIGVAGRVAALVGPGRFGVDEVAAGADAIGKLRMAVVEPGIEHRHAHASAHAVY